MSNIKAVSELSGVSVATVSRAFSTPEKVSKRAREKVFAAADQLGYKPNSISKFFRSNRTNTIVVMVPDLANPFFSRVLSGVEQTAAELGYSTLLSDTKDDPKIEQSCLDHAHTRRADGVIQLGASSAEDLVGDDRKIDVPFVHAIENPSTTDSPGVCIDNVAASRAMVAYLISLGHEHIGVVGGREHSNITQMRLRGFRSAMKAAGIPVDDSLIAYDEYSLHGGSKAAMKILNRASKVTALFCMSDEIAIGAMCSARSLGLDLPDDLSVAGFDNIAYGKYYYPALTTVTQPAELIGELAMELMDELLSGRSGRPKKQILPTELVIRKSAVPPR